MQSILRILEDSLSVDPSRYDRLTLRVSAEYTGLIKSKKSLVATFRWNSQQSSWIPVEDDRKDD